MLQIYEVTLKSKDPDEIINRIIYRLKGIDRETAKKMSLEKAGPGYEIYYVIAGPRLDE